MNIERAISCTLDPKTIKAVIWDFDGVINRSVVDGRFLWAENFEQDIGQSRKVFEEMVFGEPLDHITIGQEDIIDRIKKWSDAVGYKKDSQSFLDYWFHQDTRLDTKVIRVMNVAKTGGLRQAIATNTEPRRAKFIEKDDKLCKEVEKVFASGLMGVAKPNSEFFQQISFALGLEPADLILIDDSERNVRAALNAGWQALHYIDQDEIFLKESLGLMRHSHPR